MKPNAIQLRLARLQRECDVSTAPLLLMCAACAALVLVVALGGLTDETSPAQAVEPSQQVSRVAV